MEFTGYESDNPYAFATSVMLAPGDEDDEFESDWNDEDDDLDNQLDDLHEIQVDDDLNEPDPEDDYPQPDDDDE
ncbi:hypothetical protein SAMN05428975_0529 [Mucilaginibacter sp. OK268]|uniref:hypothetical protein n=1 Tax=Mucilaginibacter sp. OK268 TaxID=1881048 RepID=UPI00088918AB|nr:hypothetical protein [Mucilaginibacter sp. OK268]SDP16222.1 hypothetical protein SAMN05428975_0529 [Mucilaginibacter sp. OK268]